MSREWVTPEELINYTDDKSIKNKSEVKIKVLISLAKAKINQYCNTDFDNESEYPQIPEDIKNAMLILLESLCHNDNLQSSGSIKSEKFSDDYSYTAEDTYTQIEFDNLGISSLLDKYKKSNGNISFSVGVL